MWRNRARKCTKTHICSRQSSTSAHGQILCHSKHRVRQPKEPYPWNKHDPPKTRFPDSSASLSKICKTFGMVFTVAGQTFCTSGRAFLLHNSRSTVLMLRWCQLILHAGVLRRRQGLIYSYSFEYKLPRDLRWTKNERPECSWHH